MSVCRFYLQGNCSYGDKCMFRHTENKNSNQRYEDRGRTQQNSVSCNSSRNLYKYKPNQNCVNNEGYKDLSRRFDVRYNCSKKEHASFPEEKHKRFQQDRILENSGSYNPSTSRKSLHYKSQLAYGCKDPEATLKLNAFEDSIKNEENMCYAEVVREDAEEWEEGKMWLFTCYSPKMNASNFPGFHDFSFEELRQEAYNAKNRQSYDSLVEGVKRAEFDVKTKIRELRKPKRELLLLIDKYVKGKLPEGEKDDGEILLNGRSFDEEMIVEESEVTQDTSHITSKLEKAIFNNNTIKNSADSFSFNIPEARDIVKQNASAFSFKLSDRFK